MACTTGFIDFIYSKLKEVGEIRAKKIFGDWMIYIDEKPAVIACDNVCYIKMLPALAEIMKDAEVGVPYPGAKPHYILDIEHISNTLHVIRAILPLIPYPKKRSR